MGYVVKYHPGSKLCQNLTPQVKDLLRRYPEVAEAALAAVAAISPADVEEAEARAAFVWILGHHGGHIQARPPRGDLC